MSEKGQERLTARFLEAIRFVPDGGARNTDWTPVPVDENHKVLYAKEYEAFQKLKPKLMRSVQNLQPVCNVIVWQYLQNLGATTIEEAIKLLEPEAFRKQNEELLAKKNFKEKEALMSNLLVTKFIAEDLLKEIKQEEAPQQKEQTKKEFKL